MNSSNNKKLDNELIKVNKLIDSFNFEGARKILEKIIKREPDNVIVLDLLWEVYFNLNEIDLAVQVCH